MKYGATGGLNTGTLLYCKAQVKRHIHVIRKSNQDNLIITFLTYFFESYVVGSCCESSLDYDVLWAHVIVTLSLKPELCEEF